MKLLKSIQIAQIALFSKPYLFSALIFLRILSQVVLSASTKKAAFTMRTKVACNVLSVTSYTLYKSNGSVVASGSITSTSSGMRYSKSVDFSGYITSGNSYYITAVFNADGETKNASSATVSY